MYFWGASFKIWGASFNLEKENPCLREKHNKLQINYEKTIKNIDFKRQ